jgi:hypothetical protein
MAKQLRMRGVRRKHMDDEKLALAFLLLAKVLNESEQTIDTGNVCYGDRPTDQEAA